jgi:hypothetical protein
MYTTLNKIREKVPYVPNWVKLLKSLNKTEADDQPLSIISIIDSNGIAFAIWCLRAVEGHDGEIRLFAVDSARDVQHLMTDPNSIAALDTSEKFAKGEATVEELHTANETAWEAVVDAASKSAWATVIDLTWAAVEMATGAASAASPAVEVLQEKRLRELCESIV